MDQLLLTGGTGFFGRSILRYYLNTASLSHLKVTVLSRNPSKFLAVHPEFIGHKAISLHKGDIQQRDSLPWDSTFTHVLHAATDSTIGPKLTPLQRYDQIVDGTRNILELAAATGARRFLLTSSGAIYGRQPDCLSAIPEDWQGSPPLSDPETTYGHAKRAAEHLCALMGKQNRFETVVARCFTFVGPDLPLDVHFAIGNFIRDALSADSITVSGDGTPLRTYLHQRDLAHWLLTMLEHAPAGQTYNVGSSEVISIANLAYLVRDILAPSKPVHILSQTDTGTSRDRYIPDISKAKRDLGLMAKIPLSEAILQTGESTSQII